MSYLGQSFPNDRVADCCKFVSAHDGQVSIYRARRHDGSVSTSLHGVARCGQVMICPICARVAAARDGDDLRVCDQAARIKGLVRVMVTLTFSHHAGSTLEDVQSRFARALSEMRSGRAWAEFVKRYGVRIGYMGREVTYGVNGWHPHEHAYVVLRRFADIQAFAEDYRQLYDAALARQGLSASRDRGLQVDASDEGIADYITKQGRDDRWDAAAEAAAGARKRGRKGRTPFQLLDDAVMGDSEAALLFREYHDYWAGSRRRHGGWSPGFYRKMLGYNRGDEPQHVKDSMALTAALERGTLVCTLSPDDWYAVRWHRAQGVLLWLATLWDAPRIRRYVDALRAHISPSAEGVAA